jgi:hypothetical protein
MSALPASSQTVVAYLGYLLESDSISAKSLQPYLSAIHVVHNDFEYPPPACGHLVKLVRKSFAELQGSSMLQPQQVTAFPVEPMFTIVRYGLQHNALYQYGTAFDTTLSINQAVKNVARNQAVPSSRVSSSIFIQEFGYHHRVAAAPPD